MEGALAEDYLSDLACRGVRARAVTTASEAPIGPRVAMRWRNCGYNLN